MITEHDRIQGLSQNSESKWDKQFDRLWMVFMSTWLCSMFFEQKFFEDVFQSVTDYLIIIGVWFCVIGVIYFISNRLSQKSICLILFICSMLVALVWLNYAAALPLTDIQEGQCQNWDCRLMQEIAAGSIKDTWVGGWLGQSILILTQFTIMPPLFMILYQKNKNTTESAPQHTVILWMAAIFLGIGSVEILLPSYIAMLVVSIVNVIFAIEIIRFSSQSKNKVSALSETMPPQFISFNLLHFIQNFFILAGVTIFVFSFTDNDGYTLERLFEMGIGLLLLFIWNWLFQFKFANTIREYIWWLDFLFFTVLIIATAMGWSLYNSVSELDTVSGVSPIIAGLFYGYFSIRLNLYLKNPNPDQGRSIPLKFLKRPIGDLFLCNFINLLVFVVGIINIQPDNKDNYITFLPGLIVALIGLIITIWKKPSLNKT